MSQNKILKAGDLVRYHVQNAELDAIGFVLGRLYMVKYGENTLYVSNGDADIYLTFNGDLTNNADYFAKQHTRPVLPIGNQNKGA